MKTALYGLALLAVLGFVSVAPAKAHHSFTAEFDASKTISLQGVITKVDWINPHVYIYMDVKGPNGAVEKWTLESQPTGMLHKWGITKELLIGNSGETVTVVGYPAKDETKGLGFARTITYADGHFYELNRKLEEVEAGR